MTTGNIHSSFTGPCFIIGVLLTGIYHLRANYYQSVSSTNSPFSITPGNVLIQLLVSAGLVMPTGKLQSMI